MLNILIIGCGNIGKRHLFALLELKKKIKVQVLEKDDTQDKSIKKKIILISTIMLKNSLKLRLIQI